MLRVKKYNKLKNIGLNYMNKICDDEHYIDKISDIYKNDEYIKEFNDSAFCGVNLIKENILSLYILTLNDIFVISIKEDMMRDFNFLYNKSTNYVFDVYETYEIYLKNNEDIRIKIYHIFCISNKIKNWDDYLLFLRMNDIDKRYYCLTLLYGPCMIVNRRCNIYKEGDKLCDKYKFVKTIGKGVINNDIRNKIKGIIEISNNYKAILPPHYFG
jgi:Fe-S-cluster containining protein